jgi:hypothetical protein
MKSMASIPSSVKEARFSFSWEQIASQGVQGEKNPYFSNTIRYVKGVFPAPYLSWPDRAFFSRCNFSGKATPTFWRKTPF